MLACVVCHINIRIRELLKRSKFKMGRDLSAWFICMFPRAVELWWALTLAAFFWLLLVLMQLFVTELFWCEVWWCDIWSSASFLFIPCSGGQWVEGSERMFHVISTHVVFIGHRSATEAYGPLFLKSIFLSEESQHVFLFQRLFVWK